MPHLINVQRNVVTVRLTGQTDLHKFQADLLSVLEKQLHPATLILDLVLADSFGQQIKALCFRLLQHRNVKEVGICATDADIAASAREMGQALSRVRPVKMARTEHDLLYAFGLAEEPTDARRPVGMLRFLKEGIKPQEAQ